MRSALRKHADSNRVAAAILILAACTVYAAFWPGLIDLDSSRIIGQARHGTITDWWTGLGTVLLRDAFRLGISTGVLWAACVGANVVGFYGCCRVTLRRVPAAAVTAGATLFPPIYGQLASLSRDNAFMGCTLLACGALCQMLKTDGTERRGWLIGASVAAVMSGICRQNGVVVIGAVAVFVFVTERPSNLRTILMAAVVAVVVTAAGYLTLGAASRLSGVKPAYATRSTMDYDLAAISVEVHHDLFPRAALNRLGPGTVTPPRTSLSWLRRQFDPFDETSLLDDDQVSDHGLGLAAAESAVLTRAWERAIWEHPGAYLIERARLAALTLGLGGPAPPGMDGLLDYAGLSNPTNYGQPLASLGRYEIADGWLKRFIGPHAQFPLDRAWIYLVIVTGLGSVVARRRRMCALAAAIGSLVLMNQTFLFLFAPAASFRYVMVLPPLALLAIVLAGTVKVVEAAPPLPASGEPPTRGLPAAPSSL